MKQLYTVQIKEGGETGYEWLIWAHTQNIGTLPSNWNNTRQEKEA